MYSDSALNDSRLAMRQWERVLNRVQACQELVSDYDWDKQNAAGNHAFYEHRLAEGVRELNRALEEQLQETDKLVKLLEQARKHLEVRLALHGVNRNPPQTKEN